MELEKLFTQLKAKGFRITKPREAVLAKLLKSNRPLTALELLKDSNADKATIYRNIEFLLKNKILEEVYFNDGFIRYELSNQPHHHHLVCLKCNKVEAIELKEIEPALKNKIAQVNKKSAFKVIKHSIEFFGLCRNCK